MDNPKKVEGQRKFLSLIMVASGLFIWLTSDSNTLLAQDARLLIGIFLFMVGSLSMHQVGQWSKLPPEKRKKKLVVMGVLLIAIIIGMIVFAT